MSGSLSDIDRWQEIWTLDSGDQVIVRPIRPADAAIEQAFVRGLSPESKYNRFMVEVSELSPDMLARFTHIHYPHDLALIVTRIESGRETEIAVARYITLPDGTSCEFAVAVADAWQGHGLGSRLMQTLIGFARRAGLVRMEGYVLASNRTMLDLMRSLGFESRASEEGPQVKLVVRAL